MKRPSTPFATMSMPAEVDAIAPDMSEIRVLLATNGASMAHGTLPPMGISLTVRHKTCDEIWYVLGGEADVWRKQGDREETVRARAGVCLTLPAGTHFQFRTAGSEPFRFLMATIPPWPGPDECVREPDHWPLT